MMKRPILLTWLEDFVA